MTRKPTRRASSSSAAPTRFRLCDSMCWRRLRSTTQSTLLPVVLARCGAAVPDQLGIEARLGDLVIFGVDLADQVEVDEAVVHRRDQRVGLQDRRARDRVVAAGRIDDDHVGLLRPAARSRRRARPRYGPRALRRRPAAGPSRAGAWSRRGSRDSGSWSAGGCRGRARRRGGPTRRARWRCEPRSSTCRCRPFRWRRR